MSESVKKILEEFLQQAFLDFHTIEMDEVEENGTKLLRFNILALDPSTSIGKKGERLFALQHIFRIFMRKKMEGNEYEVILDIDGYRKNQEENVVFIAKEKVKELQDLGGVVEFFPMLSYQRRAIHTYINENHPEMVTESIGTGLDRKITLRLREQ